MKRSEQLYKEITDLIENSPDSASQISRSADIPLSTLTRLRSGKADIMNISFLNICKLLDYLDESKSE